MQVAKILYSLFFEFYIYFSGTNLYCEFIIGSFIFRWVMFRWVYIQVGLYSGGFMFRWVLFGWVYIRLSYYWVGCILVGG